MPSLDSRDDAERRHAVWDALRPAQTPRSFMKLCDDLPDAEHPGMRHHAERRDEKSPGSS